jgi:hypothetical protein
MPDKGDAAQEARARRAAVRVGLKARKSRWRQGSIDNLGSFQLIDPSRNLVVAGVRFELSAIDVIDYCSELLSKDEEPAPDFSEEGAFLDWLKKQPKDVAVVIAVRAALRVLPLIVGRGQGLLFFYDMALPTFRAAGVAWASAVLDRLVVGQDSRVILTAINNAAQLAKDNPNHAEFCAGKDPVPRRGFFAGEDHADPATAAAIAVHTAALGFGMSLKEISHILKCAALASRKAARGRKDVWDAASVDTGLLGSRVTAHDLAIAPLWPPGGRPPPWAGGAWARLEQVLYDRNEGWDVWIDWYRARLLGTEPDPSTDLPRATLPPELWERGPQHVNAEIRRLIDAARPILEGPAEPIPPQGAGPRFTIGGTGQIALVPASEIDASGNQIGRIRQLLPLVRSAAGDLDATLNPNQFGVLSRNLADYRAAISVDEPEIEWAIVFGLGVRLDNAADAAQRQIADRLLPSLEDPAQEALQSLRTLHGLLIMATAEGIALMEQADRLDMTREQQAVLKADAAAIAAKMHQAGDLIEPQADRIVAEAVEIIGEGRHPERGSAFGIAAFKHVTTVLVSAGIVIAMSEALGWVGAGVAWVGLKGLEKSRTFTAAITALGTGFDRLHELSEAKLHQLLSRLIPFRRFIVENEDPLRRIATNTPQMRWMRAYVDFVLRLKLGERER